MPNLESGGALLAGVALMAFCGSALGHHIGLHGLDQWPIIGLAIGLVLLNQAGTAKLRARVKRMEDAAAARKNLPIAQGS